MVSGGVKGCILCQKRLRLSREVDECKPLPGAPPWRCRRRCCGGGGGGGRGGGGGGEGGALEVLQVAFVEGRAGGVLEVLQVVFVEVGAGECGSWATGR